MKWSILGLVVLAVFIAGCGEVTPNKQVVDPITSIGSTENLGTWKDVELTNIQNENTFTIRDYEGSPVLIETFAIWCPTCLRQQQELNRLDVAHIAINIDPNEDAEQVLAYTAENGFSAPYVIAEESFTNQLIDVFGISVVNAPGAPVILVCPDGDAQLLERGLKRADELQEAVDSCA